MSQEKELKRIADALQTIAKLYENPAEYVENLTRQLGNSMSRLNISAPSMLAGPPPPGVAVTALEVRLSEDERKAVVEQAMTDIEKQMAEFKDFISQALSELPEPQLKRIGELLKKGEKFKLRRRHGCVYMDFGQGDDDFYLRM